MTNAERIHELERSLATITERVDNLRDQLNGHKDDASSSSRQLQETQQRFAGVEQRVIELERKLGERDSKQWDLRKLVFGCGAYCDTRCFCYNWYKLDYANVRRDSLTKAPSSG